LARADRTVEDRLREEYFDLLPDIRRVVGELEAVVKHCLLPISLQLHKYERLVVTARVKECESAVDALRRRQQGATFNRKRPNLYTLAELNDLAGVRILAFPRSRLAEADRKLRKQFPSWKPDPVPAGDDNNDGRKFQGPDGT
jgi:ppGpp synthetase/RelA/SpoT-type nucleotidyltranferase